jgi:hypothetical protein
MSLYSVLLVLKFSSVMGYAGGLVAAFVPTDLAARKRAVHLVASPCLLATWTLGYALLLLLGWPLFELWAVAGVVLSLVSNGALVYSVAREQRNVSTFSWATLPILCTVALMVMKPTWATVLP